MDSSSGESPCSPRGIHLTLSPFAVGVTLAPLTVSDRLLRPYAPELIVTKPNKGGPILARQVHATPWRSYWHAPTGELYLVVESPRGECHTYTAKCHKQTESAGLCEARSIKSVVLAAMRSCKGKARAMARHYRFIRPAFELFELTA